MQEKVISNGKRVTIFKVIISIMLSIIVLSVVALSVWVVTNIKKTPTIPEVTLAVKQQMQGENYVALNEVPIQVQQVFIVIEDKRFYKHDGIDFKAIERAALENLKSSSMGNGASTITQNMVKFCVSIEGSKLSHKIQEIHLAKQIEKLYSKDEILELYLNTVPIGRGAVGIEEGAKVHFNKAVEQLTITEAAALVAISSRPTYYDPIINQANNWNRVQEILGEMVAAGYITEIQREEATRIVPYIS